MLRGYAPRPLGSRCASHLYHSSRSAYRELDEEERDQERRHEDEDGRRVPGANCNWLILTLSKTNVLRTELLAAQTQNRS